VFRFAPAEPVPLKSVSIVTSSQFRFVTLYRDSIGDRVSKTKSLAEAIAVVETEKERERLTA